MSATVPTTAPPHAPIAAVPDERIRFQHPELPPMEEVLAYFERSREARWFSNGGPCARELTARLEARLGSDTTCVLVANATLGLMAALRAACGEPAARRLIVTPSYTFTATACAIRWAGFEPLFVDVDPRHWQLDPEQLERALAARAGEVAGVLACAAFGTAPPPEVRDAWRELARVAARRVLVACPTTAAAPLDTRVRRQFTAAGTPIPGWLSEHDEHGLPAGEDLAAWAAAVPGFAATAVPMANGLLCTLAVLADLDDELAAGVRRELAYDSGAWTELLASATFGDSFRDAWLLERSVPATALVNTTDLHGSATAAVRGRAAAVGAPAPAAPVRLDTRATRRLWLTPAWEQPERWVGALSAYLHAARPEDPACLAIDAASSDLGADAVTGLVAEACERLAGEAAFAEVLIVDTPVADADLLPVPTPPACARRWALMRRRCRTTSRRSSHARAGRRPSSTTCARPSTACGSSAPPTRSPRTARS